MKLLVEIPDRIYTTICFTHDNMIYDSDDPYVAKAIKNGQPIPDDCLILTKEVYEDLCIRASKASECEAEDCISRLDVDAIIEEMREKFPDGQGYILAEVLRDVIKVMPSVYPKSDTQKINDLAEEAIKATGASDAYSHGMCNGIEYMRSVLTDTKPNFLDGEYKSNKSVLDDIKSELWMEGVNMVGEYQGVWVRFKDIEKAIDNHISKKGTARRTGMSDKKIHNIKLREEFADDVESGRKNFEIRFNDRGYQTGDLVQFTVVNAMGTHFNMYWELEEKLFEITYVLSGWGLKDGYVVFGIKEIEEQQGENA